MYWPRLARDHQNPILYNSQFIVWATHHHWRHPGGGLHPSPPKTGFSSADKRWSLKLCHKYLIVMISLNHVGRECDTFTRSRLVCKISYFLLDEFFDWKYVEVRALVFKFKALQVLPFTADLCNQYLWQLNPVVIVVTFIIIFLLLLSVWLAMGLAAQFIGSMCNSVCPFTLISVTIAF